MKDQNEMVPLQVQNLQGTGTIEIKVPLVVFNYVEEFKDAYYAQVVTEELLSEAIQSYLRFQYHIDRAHGHADN